MTFNFDNPIDRRHSDSIKWTLYPEDVLPMWIADMDFASPPEVLQAMHDRIDHGVFGYDTVLPGYTESVIAWLERRHGWKVKPDDILFLPNIDHTLNLVGHAICQPNDGLLIQTPAYPPYLDIAGNARLVQQENVLQHDDDLYYSIDFDVFERAITPATKIFLLCNPQNPSGRVFRRDELEMLAEICLRKGLIICSDEIHSDLVYTGSKHIPMASLSKEVAMNSITLMAPGKTFNIAGLRSSFMVIQNPELRKRIQAANGGLAGSINLLGMVSMIAAYQHGWDWTNEVMAYLQGNRDYLHQAVNAIPGLKMGLPEATYLAWIDCSGLNLKEKPFDFMLREAKLGLMNGYDFGSPGATFVRLNYGVTRATLEEAVARLRGAVSRMH